MGLPIGTQINKWVIIGELFEVIEDGKSKGWFYPCRCMCGYEQRVRSDNLTRGHSQGHRGCKWKGTIPPECIVPRYWEYKADANRTEKDIHLKNSHIGQFFGDWLAIAVAHSDRYGHTFYRYLDSNGNVKVDRYDGSIPVTGELRIADKSSQGEKAIQEYLDKYNISYSREYIFPDLTGDCACLRFDFKTELNGRIILIEFQGKQHYEPVEFFGGQEQFELQQRYDSYKRAYCTAHNYKLIEIPYTDIDKFDNHLNFLQKNKEEA